MILYSNINSDMEVVVKLLYSIGSKKVPIRIKIEDEIFYKYFKIANPKKIKQIDGYLESIKD